MAEEEGEVDDVGKWRRTFGDCLGVATPVVVVFLCFHFGNPGAGSICVDGRRKFGFYWVLPSFIGFFFWLLPRKRKMRLILSKKKREITKNGS